MNFTSLDQIWLSPSFPMWLTLATAGFFAIVLLIVLLRAERSLANGALAVITLLAIGLAAVATLRSSGSGARTASLEIPLSSVASLPALACIDDMAGETALAACEKALFGSPDTAAAAVAYASALITRLAAKGDVAAANNNMTPELQALRRAVERDRYGLMAYVLSVRDRCQPGECTAYRSLPDHNQIAANMEERIYESTISRYAPLWGAPVPSAAPAVAALSPTMPSGKPTTADFPTAASIPPVNIMTPEPALTSAPSRPPPPQPAIGPSASPRAAPAPATPAARTAAKKQAAPKSRAAASAPVQLAPAPAAQPAPAPAETE